MKLKRSILGSLITLAVTTSTGVIANEVTIDRSKLINNGGLIQTKQQSSNYIIQLKGNSAVTQAQEIGELLPSNQLVANTGNNYNAMTPAMVAYTNAMEKKQEAVAGSIGNINILHSFKHTFNGFTAQLTDSQKAQLESHPDVQAVWQDRLEVVNTSNTPAFLGLTGPGGQHTLGIKGEDVVIGIIDTGIWPENPSFADDGSYSDPTSFGWLGSCDTANDPQFTCNNKLIGARYFNASFESVYPIQYALGEFESPRDAAGHGSHTASTAGGNENVQAVIGGIDVGIVSGMAPRARIAMYKACWNDRYENPDNGQSESGCFYGDTMAAIDQAVVDGVDVINYSIGGSRTDLTIPSTAAMLGASQAGVFVAVSAGNSGPTAETVGTPAPWVTSVAASTYSGSVPLVGDELKVTSGPLSPTGMLSIASGFGPGANNLTGDLALAQPVEACDSDPLTNAADLSGNIALIARGSCAFTEKVINAQNAGATGVIIYTYTATTPFGMGGSDPLVAIPSVMISFDDGQSLSASIAQATTNVILSQDVITESTQEIGNLMADFSSRGPNLNTYDIIKPDITAPGVKILAAYTPAPLGSNGQGDMFSYLQGTSMSSPHIAGMAALFKESNSSWTPAQIKSALMTSARQDITKEDGTTQADPFDFGSGHADPVSALDPGLLFDANTGDYLAFMCGQGEDTFVEARGTDCAELASLGHSEEGSQLNIASIAVSELIAPVTISRTVTNATTNASSYTAVVEAPAGFDVVVETFDADGTLTPANTLDVDGEGKASFALTFSKTAATEIDVWKFGAITWTDSAGHTVRLPIAVKAVPEIKIDVPASVSGTMTRGRYRFPVKMLYSGSTSFDYTGLVAPFGSAGTVAQDPDSSYSFNEPELGFHVFEVPEETKVARFSLRDSLVDVAGADLDMYVYRCVGWSCTLVGQSFNGGSNEDVILTDPEVANDASVGDVYIVFVHGWSLAGAATTNYTMPVWIADEPDSATRVISSRRAVKNRYNYTTIMARGLNPGTVYMGAVSFYNDKGEKEGTTVLELLYP